MKRWSWGLFLFNWLPFRLFAGVTLLSLFLISLGVYTLIFPLERKLRQVQVGFDRSAQEISRRAYQSQVVMKWPIWPVCLII